MSARVLLVGEDDRLTPLRLCLLAAGLEVETAPDGFYATLYLERRRPAAVLVPLHLQDMTAAELGTILADDPTLAEVRRVLVPLAGDELAGGELAGGELADTFDLVLPAGVADELLAERVATLVDPERQTDDGADLSGSLATVDFAQLTQLLAGSRAPGVLRLDLGQGEDGEARIYFDRGEIVHCTWGEASGGRAFRDILRAALAEPAPFHYERLSTAEIFKLPKSLTGSVTRLLLTAAAEIDEEDRMALPATGRERSGA